MYGPDVLLRMAVQFVVAFGAAMVLTTMLQVLVVRIVTPPWTLTMVQEGWEAGRLPKRRVRSLERMGEHGPRAIVASEDARFFLHDGFDNEAICTAVRDAWNGKRLRGASTISQQVAKNVFLWGGRSFRRKVLEAWYTFWLEALVPKKRILEIYLNVAETGPLTFGLEAGARHHFGKRAAELSRSEAGRLAGILPNPARNVSGKAAWERATWIASHPAPYPGDRWFERVEAAWEREGHSLVSCLF